MVLSFEIERTCPFAEMRYDKAGLGITLNGGISRLLIGEKYLPPEKAKSAEQVSH
jgi:hypothetical protein